MLKTNYRAVVAAVVAAVLVGAVLLSPLLCAMTCLEARGVRPSVAAEVAPTVEELAGEFVGSAVVGCVLTHAVLDIDFSGWEDVFTGGTSIWVGVEAVELIGAIGRGWWS
jgi:hypothetical protein